MLYIHVLNVPFKLHVDSKLHVLSFYADMF